MISEGLTANSPLVTAAASAYIELQFLHFSAVMSNADHEGKYREASFERGVLKAMIPITLCVLSSLLSTAACI